MPECLEGRMLLSGGDDMMSDPAMMAEHQALLDLVKPEEATVVAIRSGPWSSPSTWRGGVLPFAGADVLVPGGVAVTVDTVVGPALHTIRDDGVIRFAPDRDTGLTVDTFVVTDGGRLEMGTRDQPIATGVRAEIVIAGQGPIDTNWDPRELSRGVIAAGEVSIHGAAVTPFADVVQPPKAGDTALVLAQSPEGWHPGDQVVLAGTSPYQQQDEVLTILGISGNTVAVQPLRFDHATPSADLKVQLGDLTRNAVIRSADPAVIGMRGHVMFMHTNDVDVDDAAFLDLGRTDKSRPLDNVVLDPSGHLVPGTGLNPTGRYAVHVHRAGTDATMSPALIRDSVVWGSPGWGFVNHSSNVDFRDNLAFDVLGAAFVSEAGDEIGQFDHNLAIRSQGSGAGFDSRGITNDLGHQGFGFWFQGNGVRVTDNVAVGQAKAGFFFWAQGLPEADRGTRTFDAANLTDPSWANGQPSVPVEQVPILEFSGNVSYASTEGLELWNFHLFPANPAKSVVDDLTIWNTNMDFDHGVAIRMFYTGDVVFENLRIIGDPAAPSGTAIGLNPQTHDISYINSDLKGWGVGIEAPDKGKVTISGGSIAAVRGVVVNPASYPSYGASRSVTVDGSVNFVPLPAQALRGATQYSVFASPPSFDWGARDITALLAQRLVVTSGGKALYFPEQDRDFVPFRPGQSAPGLPADFVGKTNQQLWDQFGLSVLGAIAPADAAADPHTNALTSPTSTYVSPAELYSATYAYQLAGYRLQYTDAVGTVVSDPDPVDLTEGWNLISRVIDGSRRTFLVFGDDKPPTFQLAAGQSLTVKASQINDWIHLDGTILDDSFDPITGGLWFYPAARTIRFRADGSRYIVVSTSIGDRAGNYVKLDFELTVVD